MASTLPLPLPLATLLLVACGGLPAPTGSPLGDADGDGIVDAHEGRADADGDGLPNHLDEDSDDDGWSDRVEAGDGDPLTAPVDTDGDGTPDFLDLDSDGNGITDRSERWGDEEAPDADGDGTYDPFDVDDDGDGVPDVLEMEERWDLDTDRDGHPDRRDDDSDGDGISDAIEGSPLLALQLPNRDGDADPDLRDLDSDGDGISDTDERGGPDARDTDGDGIADYRDRDSDDDGVPDRVEHGVTSTTDPDTDGDGVRDGVEHILGTNPTDASSIPQGRVVEVEGRQTLRQAVSLKRGARQADVVFVLDADWRGDPADHVQQATTAGQLLLAASDRTGVAVATTGEYRALGYANAEWLYRLDQPLTDDADSLSMVAEQWKPGASVSQGAALETAMQALTGRGYDLLCDGHYDPATDVLPWSASSHDPFGGTGGELVGVYDATLGLLPGVGLRRRAAPVVVLVVRGPWNDPNMPIDTIKDYARAAGVAEDWQQFEWLTEGPGGCPGDAGSDELLAELDRRRGNLLIVQPGGAAADPLRTWLATQVPLRLDLDNDGVADELPIIGAGIKDPTTESMAELVAEGVTKAITARIPGEFQLIVDGAPEGMVVDVEPSVFPAGSDPPLAESTLTLYGVVPPDRTDQVIPVDIVLAEEGKVAVGGERWWVVVPGTGAD